MRLIILFAICAVNLVTGKECHIKYRKVTTGHSACKSKSAGLIRAGVSDSDIKIILDKHNSIRSMVSPPACTMFKMSWDNEVAFVAQTYAESCPEGHDTLLQRSVPGRYLTGQNLAFGKGSWKSMIELWEKEKENWVYGKASKNVGHYTQIITSNSYIIGCGFAECKKRGVYVCNYAHPGNVAGSKPYQKCTKKTPLKDCKNTLCLNSGVMDSSCKCTCQKTHYNQNDGCSLNCSVKVESILCKGDASKICGKYLNIPIQCPHLCNICPYALSSRGYPAIKRKVEHRVRYISLLCIMSILIVKV